MFYGSQHAKQSYRLNLQTGEEAYRNFFDGSAVVELALNSASSVIVATSQDRRLLVYDAVTMEKKGELLVGEHPLHKMAISPDDGTVVLSDQGCNLICIDITDATRPKIKAKDKIEGIGVPNSLHLQANSAVTETAISLLSDKKEELLLIGASLGLEFLVYDLRSN